MFVISQSPTYKYPVTVYSPKEDGTGQEKHEFKAIFKRMTVSEIKDLTSTKDLDDVKFSRAVLVGWEGIKITPDEDLPFNESSVDIMMNKVGVAKAVAQAFMDSLDGAPRKN